MNRLSCVLMKKKLISPLSLPKIFLGAQVCLENHPLFLFFLTAIIVFLGLFNSQFKRKQQLFCFKLIQPWRWGIYHLFIASLLSLFLQFSKKAFCFTQLHKGGWTRVGRQPTLSLKSSHSICLKTPLGMQTPFCRAVRGLRTDWKCLQKWGMELAGVEGVMRGASICFL